MHFFNHFKRLKTIATQPHIMCETYKAFSQFSVKAVSKFRLSRRWGCCCLTYYLQTSLLMVDYWTTFSSVTGLQTSLAAKLLLSKVQVKPESTDNCWLLDKISGKKLALFYDAAAYIPKKMFKVLLISLLIL